MFREAADAGAVADRQLSATETTVTRLVAELRDSPIGAVVTLARGSSDHAATYARYLIETRLGILTSSAAPSVSSLYGAGPRYSNTVLLAISQSGRSPDLLAAARTARESGARVVALVNAEDSPLATIAHDLIPLCAGNESSVAATKSFIASLTALVHLVARWSRSGSLLAAVQRLPQQLVHAWGLDWSTAADQLATANNMFVVGRGLGLAIAQEAALKLKETCCLHAEAISAAEVRHGPLAIVRRGFPVLVFSQRDATLDRTRALVQALVSLNARVLSAGLDATGSFALPTCPADPTIEPILQIQAFYRLANALAIRRGFDPDQPVNLSKVTETL